MKLSKREKMLLAVLLTVGLLYGYYTYLLTPQLQKVGEVKTVLAQKQQDVKYSKLQADPNNRIFTDYKGLNARISTMTLGYFPVLNQEKIILILEQMIKDSNIKVPVVTFSEPGLEAPQVRQASVFENTETDPIIQHIINEVTGKTKENSNQANTEQQNQGYQLKHMNVTVAFEGAYFDILKFINQIQNYEKKIMIKSISITANADNKLSGNINLDFYAIPKLNTQQDEEYLKWEIKGVYGKANPFAAFSGGNTSGSASDASQAKAEFTLIVSPIMSDLPSVVIGRTIDNRGDTQIYADNIGNEAVELQVYQANGKYFYKYKTTDGSYPSDYANGGAAFTPTAGAINLQVISTPRTGAQDKSGVVLTVINKTDLDFVVQVSNDDGKNPRFSTSNNSGRVTVNR